MKKCTCTGRAFGERHLETCPRRGAHSGPGGKTTVSRTYRLPIEFGDRVAELARAGKARAALELLRGL